MHAYRKLTCCFLALFCFLSVIPVYANNSEKPLFTIINDSALLVDYEQSDLYIRDGLDCSQVNASMLNHAALIVCGEHGARAEAKIQSEEIRKGTKALRIDYDFRHVEADQEGKIVLKFGPNFLESQDSPYLAYISDIAVWVKGDNSDHSLTLHAVHTDGTEKSKGFKNQHVLYERRYEMTEGWAYYLGNLGSNTPVETFEIELNQTGLNETGTIYFDDATVIYEFPTEDFLSPIVRDTQFTLDDQGLQISFTAEDDDNKDKLWLMSNLDPESAVIEIDGIEVHKFDSDSDLQTVTTSTRQMEDIAYQTFYEIANPDVFSGTATVETYHYEKYIPYETLAETFGIGDGTHVISVVVSDQSGNVTREKIGQFHLDTGKAGIEMKADHKPVVGQVFPIALKANHDAPVNVAISFDYDHALLPAEHIQLPSNVEASTFHIQDGHAEIALENVDISNQWKDLVYIDIPEEIAPEDVFLLRNLRVKSVIDGKTWTNALEDIHHPIEAKYELRFERFSRGSEVVWHADGAGQLEVKRTGENGFVPVGSDGADWNSLLMSDESHQFRFHDGKGGYSHTFTLESVEPASLDYAPKAPLSVSLTWKSPDPSTHQGFTWFTHVSVDEQVQIEYEPIENDSVPSGHLSHSKYADTTYFTTNKGEIALHTVELEALQPGTQYAYRVGGVDDNGEAHWSDTFTFTTPANDESYRFIVLGDTQSYAKEDSDKEEEWYDRFADVYRNAVQDSSMGGEQPAFVIHAGDIVERDYNWQEWADLFASAGDLMSQHNWLISGGNHDINDRSNNTFSKVFNYGNNEIEEALSFGADQGGAVIEVNNAIIGIINPEFADNWYKGYIEAQLREIEEKFAASNADWRMIVVHQPLYPTHEGRRTWIPEHRDIMTDEWLEDHHIDVVWSGHDHAYARTEPLNPYGTISVQAGQTGRKYYDADCSNPIWASCTELKGENDEALRNYITVHVEEGKMHVVVKLEDGTLIDEFELKEK